MNANARKWIDALRSGKFKQGKGRLHPDPESYCCLGVACELYRRETGKGEWVEGYGPVTLGGAAFQIDDDASYAEAYSLPDEVMAWLSITDPDGYVGCDDGVPGETLAELNDNAEFSFEQIAAVIETRPGLFDD